MAVRLRLSRLQFGLTTFFVAITLICLWLGNVTNTWRKHKAVIELVHQRRGQIVFQHQHDNEIVIPAGTPITSENMRQVGGSRSVVSGSGGRTFVTDVDIRRPNYDAPPPGPAWLRSWLGDDFLQTVYSLSLQSCNDKDLALISTLPHVKQLRLGGVEITNEGLSHLSQMKSLESFTLNALLVDDEGLEHLRSLVNLKELTLYVNAGPEAVERLNKALPQCKINSTVKRSFSPPKQ